MKILLLWFILLLNFVGISQSEEKIKQFDSIFYETSVNTSTINPTKALHVADSLYKYSLNSDQKVKSLMLSAIIYEKQEQRMKGIEYAIEALEIAEESTDYYVIARIYGFMSMQYRRMGISDKGKEFIQQGFYISSKIEDINLLNKYQSMAYQELADYAMDDNEYEKAIEFINLALEGYNKEANPRIRNFQIANAEEFLGRCYTALGKYEQAFINFSKAKTLINESEAANSLSAAMIYLGIGSIYLQNQQIDSAGLYLKRALKISENTNNGSLKESLYEGMYKYHMARNYLDSSAIYAYKYKDISIENKLKNNQMVNSEFNRLSLIPEEKANNTPFYMSALVILGSAILFTIYTFGKKKIVKTHPEEIIVEDILEENNSTIVFNISASKQAELLEKLKEFESSEVFLDKNMSFSVLVSHLNTNTKYLNYILKNLKKKDFNTYINDLRIENIISKLTSDSDFLKYKISYLAEVSGFSSHSNFSANFRRVTEVSPSEFIESIKSSA